jgi:hypothetical protein
MLRFMETLVERVPQQHRLLFLEVLGLVDFSLEV